MIIYNNASPSEVIGRMRGSVLPVVCGRVSIAAFIVQGTMLALRIYEVDLEIMKKPPHPFSLRWMSVILGFTLGLRTSLAYRRFMDSMDALSTGWSKWIFCFSLLQAFLEASKMDVRKVSRTRDHDVIPAIGETYDERVTYAQYEMARTFSWAANKRLEKPRSLNSNSRELEIWK